MKSVKLLLLAGAIMTLAGSCQKEQDTFEGPALNDLFGEFIITAPLATVDGVVDFAAGEKGNFLAEFSINVDWKLEIIGQTTGATKILTGFSNNLSVSDAVWDGSTTLYPIFGQENCDVRLTFDEHPDTLTAGIIVQSVKSNNGILISDFENGFNVEWEQFVQNGANMNFQITNGGALAQGNNYFSMAGAVSWDYLIGLIDFNAAANGYPVYPLTPVANDVYLNVLLYGEPGIVNGFVIFRFTEDENLDGVFDPNTEDTREYRVDINFQGWQLYNINYGDVVQAAATAGAQLAGNGVADSDKIHSVDVLMLADPATGFTQAHMDYLILSEGSPIIP